MQHIVSLSYTDIYTHIQCIQISPQGVSDESKCSASLADWPQSLILSVCLCGCLCISCTCEFVREINIKSFPPALHLTIYECKLFCLLQSTKCTYNTRTYQGFDLLSHESLMSIIIPVSHHFISCDACKQASSNKQDMNK